ncbi:unnamed protein product [Hapterophycus canaliculatus]
MWLLRFQIAATVLFSLSTRKGQVGTLVFAQTDTDVVSKDCSITDLVGYDYKVEPESGLSLHWKVSPLNDISLKVVSIDLETRWLSIGFSADGDMIGSDAVVGSTEEEKVLEYELGAKALPVQPPSSPVEGSIRLFSDEEQEITVGVFERVDGVTSLSFTRPMTPEVGGKNALLTGTSNSTILLWAAGPDDAFGYHFLGKGAFTFDLMCPDAQPPDSGTEAGVAEPGTTNPFTQAPSVSPEVLEFSTSPTVAPVVPLTLQPVDDSTSGGALPRFHRAGGGLVASLRRGFFVGGGFDGALLALVLFAAGVLTSHEFL